MYVFMFVGLAIFKLPGIFNPPENLSATGSVVLSVLGAIALLAVLGLRYPVKMLPLDQLSRGYCVGSTRDALGLRIQPLCEGARRCVG
jgi:hypothetical protein